MAQKLDTLADAEAAAKDALSRGDIAGAVPAFRALTRLAPDRWQVWLNLGMGFTANPLSFEQHKGEAIVALKRCLLLHPSCGKGWRWVGSGKGDADEEELCFIRSSTCPDAPYDSLAVSAAVYQQRGDAPGAVERYRRALAMKEVEETRINLASALIELGEIDEVREVLGSYPMSDPRAEEFLGWCKLAERDRAGYALYQKRWADGGGCARMGTFKSPLWMGESGYDGTLALWGEFGVGDEVCFANFIPEALRRAKGKVRLECNGRLQPLFQRSFPEVEVVAHVEDAAPSDGPHCPTTRLPCLFDTPLDEAYEPARALVPDLDRVRYWKEVYSTMGPGPYTGVNWRGGTAHTGPRKSVPLELMAPLFGALSGTLISLQRIGEQEGAEIHAAELAGRPVPLLNPDEEIGKDLDDLAAQIAALDQVICISSTNAHMAGAVRTPGLILMQENPLWFWFKDGESVPWYPSLRLFRQHNQDWREAIERAIASLDQGRIPRNSE